jgi:hypothetical protein
MISMFLPGCFLKPKKKSSKKAAVNELVDKGSIFMDRVGDGDSALLQFKTYRTAKCKLEFYSQDSSSTPTREKPETVECVNQDAGKVEFAEKIPGLSTDNLYFVVIFVWDSGADEATAQRLTIKETANTDTVITDGGEDLSITTVNVARLNVPLKVGEFHRYKFDTPIDLSGLKQSLNMTTGCIVGVPTEAPTLSKSNIDMPIANLATRDFAAGTAGKHPEYPGRLQVNYSGVNELMEKWTLLYTEDGKDHSITARPVSRIINLEMQSSETGMAFGEPQLAEAADPLKIAAQQPLKLTWTVGSTLLENTFMTVQIGRSEDPKAIYCAFPASKRSAEVPASLLAGLEEGRHVVLVEMIANQIWLKDSWVIMTYDWRSGRIEK